VRKYLAIVLSVLLVLSVAATASAMDTEVKLGGKILVRGWYFDNVSNSLPQDSSSQAVYTTNANIILDIMVDENVRGFMELETACFGNENCGLYFWGTQNPNGGYDTKADADLFFRQLWIMYTGSGLLGVPAGIKVGHMPITLGEKQFLNNERFGDDAILVWVDPTKELHLAVGTAKLVEEVDGLPLSIGNHTDDVDGYIALATYALDKDNTLGINWTWIHSDGNCPSLGASPNVDSLDFHNIGAHANGNISGITYAAEVDIQTGELENINLVPGDDLKAKGWAAFVKLGYMLDPINIRGSFAYGSGDDDLNDDDCKEFQTLQGPDGISAFARLVHYTQIYERTLHTSAISATLTTTPGGNVRNTGIANTTYFNLGMDWKATPDLNLSLDGFYLMASETEGWEQLAGHSVDETIGWELDFKGTYKIAKNLSYFVEAAGFWAGDFYEESGLVADKETVTQLIHGLLLTF